MSGVVILYDGSFEGLLCVIKDSLENNICPEEIIPESIPEEPLFFEKRHIDSDLTKAKMFFNVIRNKLTTERMRRIFCSFLSETKNAELYILNYIRLVFEKGAIIERDYSNEIIWRVISLDRKVMREAYRLKGLIRFQKHSNGFFYARIEPLYNVLCLLVPHFTSRYKNEKWIIHDLKRGLCALYNGTHCRIAFADENRVDGESSGEIFDKDEKMVEELWKLYFKTIAIHERKNPSLQRSHMPCRYWKNILEVQE